MTDLISALIVAGRQVVSFPIVEYWLDVGRPDDYASANQRAASQLPVAAASKFK
jgi:NDP-sugar pyrophosphorylase family protein